MSQFDDDVISRLEADLGHEGLVKLLEIFSTEIVEKSETVMAQVRSGDLQAARVDSHALKAASRSVGAMSLGEVCARVEEYCAAGRASYLEPLVLRMQQEGKAALAFVEARWGITPES